MKKKYTVEFSDWTLTITCFRHTGTIGLSHGVRVTLFRLKYVASTLLDRKEVWAEIATCLFIEKRMSECTEKNSGRSHVHSDFAMYMSSSFI